MNIMDNYLCTFIQQIVSNRLHKPKFVLTADFITLAVVKSHPDRLQNSHDLDLAPTWHSRFPKAKCLLIAYPCIRREKVWANP
jgi:hypothetical protein